MFAERVTGTHSNYGCRLIVSVIPGGDKPLPLYVPLGHSVRLGHLVLCRQYFGDRPFRPRALAVPVRSLVVAEVSALWSSSNSRTVYRVQG